MIYDDLDRHMTVAGSIDRAAVPMGMYLAWAVNLNLISRELTEVAEQAVLRVRYREITGSELLVSGCGGTLDSRWFSEAGASFCERYYSSYLGDYRDTFGDDVYQVTDDWPHYDQLAPLLTRRLYGPKPGRRAHKSERPGSWWKFWR
jgi:hypothetical protein